MLARITPIGGDVFVVEQLERRVDPGFGGGIGGGVDPDYGMGVFPHPGHGLPGGGGHPGHALPVPPVRPTNPIVLPPGVWPPQLPPGIDNSLPDPDRPTLVPPDPDLGIEHPIYLPELPPGVALLIALPAATPKAGTPPGTKPALLVQSGKKPVLVYVSAAASPK
jgi:hypothetical protein